MPATTLFAAAVLMVLLTGAEMGQTVLAASEETREATAQQRQYTFAWPFVEGSDMQPRGGTSHGAEVTLAPVPSAAWQALQEDGLSAKERDRRAILAMAGPYRTSFDFIETVGFTTPYQPPRPYQSWATEYIYIIADEPDFISLQHILVMHFEQQGESPEGPMVVKHWRQDWRYQDRDLHVYAGNNRWVHKELTAEEVRGKWSQAVFQVDDSPRYEAIGVWHHEGGVSSWLSDETWRPLPRREFSVRDDYQVLVGSNRHTITPDGWVHEEDNLKVVLDESGRYAPQQAVLAREAGLNRYQLIDDHDWSAGDAYWERTAPFWAQVRAAWDAIYRQHPEFELHRSAAGQSLFMTLFELADASTANGFDPAAARREIDNVLRRFLVNPEAED